jgi:hypothetical protein
MAVQKTETNPLTLRQNKNYICHTFVEQLLKGMNYKKFRESKKEYFVTKDGRFTKAEIIKQLETWLTQKLGEPQDFFDKNQVKEDKK